MPGDVLVLQDQAPMLAALCGRTSFRNCEL